MRAYTLSYEQINIYPNPNNGMFILESETILTDADVQIFDTQGRFLNVGFKKINQRALSLDLSAYNSGIYIININANGKQTQMKVVKL